MDESQQKTVAIKPCAACASGLLERDRFCRWCGVLQPDEANHMTESLSDPAAYKTAMITTGLPTGLPTALPSAVPTGLAAGARGEVYHRVSAPLIEAVLTGALAGHSIDNENRLLRRVMLTLISVPVWLIIVLLSPLDAYAAVRNLARQA